MQQHPDFLTIDWVLNQFGKQPVLARKKYIEFVYAGIGNTSPWNELQGKIVLGKKVFLMSIEKLIGKKANIPDIPRAQRFMLPKPIIDPVSIAQNPKERNRIINELHYKNAMAINQIAKIFSLHPSTVSKIINRS